MPAPVAHSDRLPCAPPGRRPAPQCFPSEGPQLLAPALQRLLADLLGGRESGLVSAAALGVYARVLLHNAPAFLQLFQASGGSGATKRWQASSLVVAP